MKSVLIVDDEHDIALAVELLLQEEGFEVIVARNGKEALNRLAEKRPVVVLLDVMMPVLNGLETLKVIRADPEYQSLPVILMSAVRPNAQQIDYGWNVFLPKPFQVDDLLNAIEKVLGSS